MYRRLHFLRRVGRLLTGGILGRITAHCISIVQFSTALSLTKWSSCWALPTISSEPSNSTPFRTPSSYPRNLRLSSCIGFTTKIFSTKVRPSFLCFLSVKWQRETIPSQMVKYLSFNSTDLIDYKPGISVLAERTKLTDLNSELSREGKHCSSQIILPLRFMFFFSRKGSQSGTWMGTFQAWREDDTFLLDFFWYELGHQTAAKEEEHWTCQREEGQGGTVHGHSAQEEAGHKNHRVMEARPCDLADIL